MLALTSNQGKLEAGYRIAEDVYFYNLAEHLRQLQPQPGQGYWCYSPWITKNKLLVDIANQCGFHAIELHSPSNPDYPPTDEQMRVYNCISATGLVPLEYDFVIVNSTMERGVDINDRRFDVVIIDSTDAAVRAQAARQTFNYTRHLKVFAPAVPDEYKNRWLTVSECRNLAEWMSVPEKISGDQRVSRPMTWNKLKDKLSYLGYQVETKKDLPIGKSFK